VATGLPADPRCSSSTGGREIRAERGRGLAHRQRHALERTAQRLRPALKI
jgi:hypothetical protein